MKITVEMQHQNLLGKFRKMQLRSKPEMAKAMNLSLIFVEARIKENVRRLLRKTIRTRGNKTGIAAQGRLSTNWGREIKWKGKDIIGTVGTRVKYARIQEIGGPIVPVNVKALTIPISTRAFPTARELRDQGNTFISNGIIYFKDKSKPKSKPIPVYVLKRKVIIPGKFYMKKAVDLYTPKIIKMLSDAWKPTEG